MDEIGRPDILPGAPPAPAGLEAGVRGIHSTSVSAPRTPSVAASGSKLSNARPLHLIPVRFVATAPSLGGPPSGQRSA